MSTYIAPIRDMQFVLNEIAGLEEICALPGNEECSVDLVESILDEASKFATGVLDPINNVGDRVGHVAADARAGGAGRELLPGKGGHSRHSRRVRLREIHVDQNG